LVATVVLTPWLTSALPL